VVDVSWAQTFVEDYAARLRELEAELAELRRRRDAAIRRAHRAGVPVVAIAELFKLSDQRVSTIVRR
jgi:hypothetical protein